MVSMVSAQENFYLQWRARRGVSHSLQEQGDSPPEELLQAVWQHQRLKREEFKTLEGAPVRVLHPGFRSVEGGPDFRGAVVQIGDEPARTGDVEVDLRSNGWKAHGHDRNPAFASVILHVIWDGERAAKDGPPVMVLHSVLDAPLGELSVWLGSEAAQAWPEALRGQCCAPLKELNRDEVLKLLGEAAAARLRSKAAHFQARARQAGWEQSLWEGLFRALGYKHNMWPMQRLAELRPRWCDPSAPPVAMEARLFGLSGLLPEDLTRAERSADDYLRRVWDHWWRERDTFADCMLPRTLWRLHGVRPGNHPQRRLALASRWAGAGNLAQKVEKWCAAEIPDSQLTSSLLKVLQAEPDEFWLWHCTLRSGRLKHAQPLLGATRTTDLAVNVVLPWLWARASEGKSAGLLATIERRYFAWPAAEDNSLLKLARQRLLAGAARGALKTAASQQGLLQIVRDFCEHSNALCDNCRFPELVRAWKAETISFASA